MPPTVRWVNTSRSIRRLLTAQAATSHRRSRRSTAARLSASRVSIRPRPARPHRSCRPPPSRRRANSGTTRVPTSTATRATSRVRTSRRTYACTRASGPTCASGRPAASRSRAPTSCRATFARTPARRSLFVPCVTTASCAPTTLASIWSDTAAVDRPVPIATSSPLRSPRSAESTTTAAASLCFCSFFFRCTFKCSFFCVFLLQTFFKLLFLTKKNKNKTYLNQTEPWFVFCVFEMRLNMKIFYLVTWSN